MASLSPPPPPIAADDPHWCDQGMSPPCLLGMSVYIWVLLIVGSMLTVCCCLLIYMSQRRRGNTCSSMCTFMEAVFTAGHSDPKRSRVYGRASSSHPRMDLAEAQNCCCCFPLSVGLVLLGVIDMTRLGLAIAYAADSLSIYMQTDTVRFGPDAAFAGLMVPHAREVAEGFLWPSLVISSIKCVIWLLVYLTICCECVAPIQLLLLYLPADFVHTIFFAAHNCGFAQELCQVDIRVYDASGHVGVRRNYLPDIPPRPLFLDGRGVPEVCLSFQEREIAVCAADVVGCFLLSWCIFYIGYSRIRSWRRHDGPIRDGIRGPTQYV